MTITATISPCGRYRYTLTRDWTRGAGRMLWVMLNPSTADASMDDPTIRRCVSFAQSWGFCGLTVVNLFALRATDPRELARVDDPIGPDNNEVIARAAHEHLFVCAGWGAHGSYLGRSAEVIDIITRRRSVIHCLGTTKSGEPRHPLYLPKRLAPIQLTRDTWEPKP